MFPHGSCTPRRYSAAIVILVQWVVSNSTPALGDSPALDFDLGPTAECRDVTAEFCDDAPAGQRLVECTLRFSVQHVGGDLGDVRDLRIEVFDCDRSMRVHSFSPTTRMTSQYTGAIERTITNESSNTFGITLGGELPAPIGDVVAHVAPSVSGGRANREVVTEKEKRLPPKEVLVASGTIEQEHGVFFRLRPSPQTTLEGMHELTVRFLVDADWRGDIIAVRSSASGEQKFLWVKQQKKWAQETQHVVLFLEGDEAARHAAERHAQRRL